MECDISLNSAFRNYAEFFREKPHTIKRRYSEGLSLYFWFQRLPENNIEHSKQNWTFCHCNDIGSNKTYCCCVFLHIVLRALGKHSDWVCHRSWICGDAIFKMTCANACERWETEKWLLLSRLQFYSFFCLISSAKKHDRPIAWVIKGLLGYQCCPLLIFAGWLESAYSSIYT